MGPFETKTIVCLANSRKTGGRCVAGKEYGERSIGRWIRPVSHRPDEELTPSEYLYGSGTEPKLLDIVQIPILRHKPTEFQKENYLVTTRQQWVRAGAFPDQDVLRLCDSPDALWGQGCSSRHGMNDRISQSLTPGIASSLYLITLSELCLLIHDEEAGLERTRRRIRAKFVYNDDQYIFSVTDPRVEETFRENAPGSYEVPDPRMRVFMCVSLGLAWKDGYCYKFVASIIAP